MEGAKQQALVLALLEAMKERGSWCGETHLQKCTYFLQAGLGVPLNLDFVLYRHGPFSFELRELLGDMRARLLIEVQPFPPYGPSLEVSSAGRRFRERFPTTTQQYTQALQFVATHLSPRGVGELERLGTALYVTRENGARLSEERARRIVELKPHIPEDLAQVAVREVDALLAQSSTLSGV